MSSKYFTAIALFLCACTSRDSARNPSVEEQKTTGIVRFSTIEPKDVVYLDGEEIIADGLARSRNELILAPGAYALRITTSEGKTCDSILVIKPGAIVVPNACGDTSRQKHKDDRVLQQRRINHSIAGG